MSRHISHGLDTDSHPWNKTIGGLFGTGPAASAHPYWIVESATLRERLQAPDGMHARETFERNHPGVPVTSIAKEIWRRY